MFAGTSPERGLAHLGRARPAVRDAQGGGDARRPRRRPRRALGFRRGVAPARPRAARGLGRCRRRDGHGASRCTVGSTRAVSRRHASRGGSPSGAARSRRARTLELRSRPLRDELAALAAEGVQSLLLEGGPTLAAGVSGRGSRRQAARSSSRRPSQARARASGATCRSPSPHPSQPHGRSATTSCSRRYLHVAVKSSAAKLASRRVHGDRAGGRRGSLSRARAARHGSQSRRGRGA